MSTYAQPPVQSYPRAVYNYTLPEDFFRQSRTNFPRHFYTHAHAENTINPQQLMVSSPTSSPTDDYLYPIPQSPVPYGPRLVERNPSVGTATKHRKRTLQTVTYPEPYQTSSYSSELPTPPLSPSSTILSGTTRRSSTSSATMSRRPSSTMNMPYPPASPRSSDPSSRRFTLATTTTSSTSQRYFCSHPECTDSQTGKPTRSFSRRADLQRHHACAHESATLFSCPRPNCIRKGDNGFTRQDHLIEHRRGYHAENIPKRGSRGGVRTRSPRR